MANSAFHLSCKQCSRSLPSFKDYFLNNQRCECGSDWFNIKYEDYAPLGKALRGGRGLKNMWQYRELLPLLDDSNIITANEGAVAIERWKFLEEYAQKAFGTELQVHVHRHDNCNATGTFKDLAASVAASVLKENKVDNFVVSSTGNIGVAYSRYLAQAEIPLYVFIPSGSPMFHAAEIACFGQKVFKVQGDYVMAKKLAKAFSEREGMLQMAGTFDPMRIEAKKMMAYEWVRQMDEVPTVYIQALSGGTGPLGVHVGSEDLVREGFMSKAPRFILAQSNQCPPMADAWAEAEKTDFPKGWEQEYPVYDNPDTEITTLATGNPTAYPAIASLVKDTDGAIIDVPEDKAVDYARLVAFESAVRIGPAAAIAVGGFFKALHTGRLRNGDVLVINLGEGLRRAPDFMAKMLHSLSNVRSLDECSRFNREKYRNSLWENIATDTSINKTR